MTILPDHAETGRPAWWKWFRLREGRTIYSTKLVIQHQSGSSITVTVEGKDPEVVSRFTNHLRSKHAKDS